MVYKEIKTRDDTRQLQEDMDSLASWEHTWGMKFHPDKCETVTFTRKRKPLILTYHLNHHPLKRATSAKYLGVTMSSTMDWSTHIDNSVKKASKTLGFLRRNLRDAPTATREMAYKAMVRPQVEYCCTAWDP